MCSKMKFRRAEREVGLAADGVCGAESGAAENEEKCSEFGI